jgi:LPS O-antigen subunit length determinant protein (WzzB/FepE family)
MKESNDNKQAAGPSEIDFRDLLEAIVSNKFLIILLTSLFAIGSVFYSLSLKDIYTSNATLSIVDSSVSKSNSLSQYSGLAAMAGVSLPSSSGSNKKYLAIETIKSRDFFRHLLSHDFVLPALVAYKSYDKNSKKINWNNDIYNISTNEWTKEIPSFLEAYMLYGDAIKIDEDIKSGFIRVSVKHISPQFAYEFLELIIDELNLVSRQRDIEESNKSLSYLYQQLETIKQADIKKSINNLIEAQLKIQMHANINDEYLLSKLDKPYLPEKKSSPSRARLCITWTILGFFISVMVSIFRYFIYSKNKI